jgi:hypothetical protein
MYLIMLGAERPLDEFRKALKPHPEVMVWCVLVATQVAIWSYVAGPAYKRARRYVASFSAHRRSVISDFIVLVLLFGIFVYAHRRVTAELLLPVIGQEAKVPLLNVLGFAALLPCLLGMRLIALAGREQAAVGLNSAMLDRFAQLRDDLNWFLSSAAVIIGAATLANGAFRNALNALNPKNLTPATEVLLYGGFCSGVLALFYLSSHEVFSRSGWALIRAAEPVVEDSTSAWAEAQARRSKLAEVMGVGTSSVRAFQDGAVLLTPLFGSGVALL